MNIKRIILIIVSGTLIWSCDSMFAPKQIDEVLEEDMWSVPDMARGVLFKAYSAMPSVPDSWDNNFLDAATDNAVTNSFNTGIYRLGLGTITATNCPLAVWSQAYNQFQNIHEFLLKGLTDKTVYSFVTEDDSDEKTDSEVKQELEAEAYYLRAWWGYYLLLHYGGKTADGQALGYPIVREFITPEKASDFSWIKRDTYEACVEQICSDCDKAAAGLRAEFPASATEDSYIGRATSIMAEFLKARVLLYAASPAYQPDDIVKITGMGTFTVVDPVKYKEKWERAAQQAWKVMNLPGFGNYVAMKRTDIVDVSETNPKTPAHFVARYFFQTNGMESRHYPPYYFGSCNTAPSQNLVDAYPMKANGYPIDHEESGYDENNPYVGRDNRFELTVYHQGSQFGGETSSIDVVYGGKDSESFMSGGNRASRTGYYLAKFMSQKAGLLNPIQTSTSIHFYPTMRTAEMFFAFAEAANEAWGPEGIGGEGITKSAYDVMKEIRKKSGGITNDLYIEEIKGDKDAFREMIQNERRIEFAFENFRFWDMRRWLLPLDTVIRKVVVDRASDGTLSYDTTQEVEKRGFDDIHYYYLPIPYAEVMKNPSGMINNMGY